MFDSLTETTYVGSETHRLFFHAFMWGSKFMYAEFFFYPRTQQEIQANLNEMELGGFPGCVGITDATHIAPEQCSARLKNAHAGDIDNPTPSCFLLLLLTFIYLFYLFFIFLFLIIGKEKKPTRTYNATVDHHRKFLNVTPGHPGRWNDKTLVLFDEYVQKIRNGEIFR